MSGIVAIGEYDQIYWIRENNGRITAALSESAFTPTELADELDDMQRHGPIKRVVASRIVIGEALKHTTEDK